MKNPAHSERNSLKTFYLYILLVLCVICIALLIKGFFIIQQSKFDPSHDFTLAVTEQGKVKELISFHPQVPSLESLLIQDNPPYQSLAKDYGIHTDGYIQVDDNNFSSDVTAFMWASVLHTDIWQSNLTIIDKFRLMLLSKGVTSNNKSSDTISLSNPSQDTSTEITTDLTDQEISNENITIQIINATNISGFGQRLERVLSTMGANVVQISTAQNIQKKSTIAYYGDESYTLDRIEKVLGLTATKLQRQQIADIVITIGTDKSSTNEF